MKKPKAPEEDPAVGRMRDRQIEELAQVDEEENRRLKAAFTGHRGARMFRSARSGSSGGGSTAAPRIPGGRLFNKTNTGVER